MFSFVIVRHGHLASEVGWLERKKTGAHGKEVERGPGVNQASWWLCRSLRPDSWFGGMVGYAALFCFVRGRLGNWMVLRDGGMRKLGQCNG